jgi:gas vesicle protein
MCLRGEAGMNYRDWDVKDKVSSSGGLFSSMFFVGAAVGLFAGLLLAPKPGEESQGMVKDRFSLLRNKVMRRESINGAGSEEGSVESAVRADYLH